MHLLQNWEQKEGRERSYLSSFMDLAEQTVPLYEIIYKVSGDLVIRKGIFQIH